MDPAPDRLVGAPDGRLVIRCDPEPVGWHERPKVLAHSAGADWVAAGEPLRGPFGHGVPLFDFGCRAEPDAAEVGLLSRVRVLLLEQEPRSTLSGVGAEHVEHRPEELAL